MYTNNAERQYLDPGFRVLQWCLTTWMKVFYLNLSADSSPPLLTSLLLSGQWVTGIGCSSWFSALLSCSLNSKAVCGSLAQSLLVILNNASPASSCYGPGTIGFLLFFSISLDCYKAVCYWRRMPPYPSPLLFDHHDTCGSWRRVRSDLRLRPGCQESYPSSIPLVVAGVATHSVSHFAATPPVMLQVLFSWPWLCLHHSSKLLYHFIFREGGVL